MSKSVVVVSRKWSQPLIKIDVRVLENDTEIAIEMSLDYFIDALCHEIGSPAMLMTQARLTKAAQEASHKVVDGMKAETVQVM